MVSSVLMIWSLVAGCGGDDTVIEGKDDAGTPGTGGDATFLPGDTTSPPDQDVPVDCTPNCTGKSCGPDGCGGSCGGCTDTCTGAENVAGLCVEGSCAVPCGGFAVSVEAPRVSFDELTAYLYPNTPCGAAVGLSPEAALATSATVQSSTALMTLSPVPMGAPHTVVVRAKGPPPDLATLSGCIAGVSVDGQETPVTVSFAVSGPTSFIGVWLLQSELDLSSGLPPAAASLVDSLDEMSDDDDLLNDDPDNGQYGQDPAAFMLDFVYRQFCCWEATGPEPSWDTCKDQDFQHKFGDLSAIYLNDFTEWQGAWPITTGACGALGAGVDPLLQSIVMTLLEEKAPGVATFLKNLPKDLAEAIRHMKIDSRLTLSNAKVTSSAFQHELLTLRATLHDLDGGIHEAKVSLDGAGLTSIVTTGTATFEGPKLVIPAHTFQIETGKLLGQVYKKGVLPLLGFETTEAMLQSFIDCEKLGLKIADEISLFGLLDEKDYEKFCKKGLEEASEFIEDTVESVAESTTVITIDGSALAGSVDNGSATTLIDGVWNGTWTEAGSEGQFPGAFEGERP